MAAALEPDPFSTASRLPTMDRRGARYDPVTMALHWITALLVVTQFGLAETWESVPRATRHLMMNAHMSFGPLLALIIALRLAWRLSHASRMPRPAGRVGRASHVLLYALLVAEVTLGFVLRWSTGDPLIVFGLPIPSPFVPFSHEAHRLLLQSHGWTAWSVVTIAGLHAVAALVHTYVFGDDTLRRMVPGVSARRPRRLPPNQTPFH